jgi:N,N'-diacetylchitobiose transport system substrate-binding protein
MRPAGWSFAAAILACSCTGDGGSADPGDDPTPTSTFSGTLTAWFLDPGSAPGRAAVESAIDSFEAAHPAVAVSVEFLPESEARDKLTAAHAADQAPDVAQTSIAWTAALAAQGFLASAAPADGVEYVDSMVEPGVVDGTSYAYPLYGDSQALIYRTDVFTRANVSPPTTWEEIFSVGDTIAAKTPEIVPMQVGGAHLDLQAPLVWAGGGEIATLGTGGWRSGVDSTAGRAAFSHFESVWKKGWSPRSAVTWTPDEIRTAFAEGRSAMMIGSLADARAILAANPKLVGKLGSALLPAGPDGNRDAVVSGAHLVVVDRSAQHEAAVALVQHLTAEEQVVPIADAQGFLPGTRAGIEAAVSDDELRRAFGEQLLNHSRSYPTAPWWPEVVSAGAFEAATQQLMHGRITAHEAAATVDAAVRRAIG